MSARKRRLILTGPAQDDVRSIVNVGETTWGERQSARYHAELEAVRTSLTRFPDLDRRRDERVGGLRSLAVGEHVIYYQHDRETVTVLRILHRRMNAEGHLPLS